MQLTLGHSPDPDDAFMFFALAQHRIPMGNYEFTHILQDIQTLNERAIRAELDITAVSFHASAYVLDNYAILRCGASMGDNYGPMLVAKQGYTRDDMYSARIAIPGRMTSAFLALQMYLGVKAEELNLITVPFDEIFDALDAGTADVGLIIHEGQLTYQDSGFVLCEDLGRWWYSHTGGLPLPLGCNVIRKSLGEKVIAEISDILHESIKYGLVHRAEGVAHALPLGRGLDSQRADEFIGMYVNDLTVDYGDRGRRAVEEFMKQAHEQGLIPAPRELQFV
ncbi:ABC transporter substrate-binding protein [Verrucomicrobia bacterium LW23]|nr:ABC transporter substrate-binding protein [Verrucomicrobia bacterium LW23]